jgi:hypothetical protein
MNKLLLTTTLLELVLVDWVLLVSFGLNLGLISYVYVRFDLVCSSLDWFMLWHGLVMW